MRPMPIFSPGDRPMNILFLASGGPGNLRAVLDLAMRLPSRLRVGMVCADRPGTPSMALASTHGIPMYEDDFRSCCGDAPAPGSPDRLVYDHLGEAFHDRMLRAVVDEEARSGRAFDLAVLAYRRIIRGSLLRYLADRMINQHPADLACLDGGRRLFVGIGGHHRSLRAGKGGARTSTILVTPGVDHGEILCQGPFVPFGGNAQDREQLDAHEQIQKQQSDWPSLTFALCAISRGGYAVGGASHHPGGLRTIFLDGHPLPYAGYACEPVA